ncbi:hypothetical protein M514_27406 [Trichuris suis]|uniref:Uncharacterized protein n=1 Tax=Trichuris suis TaxID=68888 RepID=A0A085MT67_9BILA|nr:hypothetical protein M514_27406 [Trichuris suis]
MHNEALPFLTVKWIKEVPFYTSEFDTFIYVAHCGGIVGALRPPPMCRIVKIPEELLIEADASAHTAAFLTYHCPRAAGLCEMLLEIFLHSDPSALGFCRQENAFVSSIALINRPYSQSEFSSLIFLMK